MAVAAWLIDKSALVPPAIGSSAWAERIECGFVRITAVTLLGVLHHPLISATPVEYRPAIDDHALEVQLALAGRGKHRGPSIPDLSSPPPQNSPA